MMDLRLFPSFSRRGRTTQAKRQPIRRTRRRLGISVLDALEQRLLLASVTYSDTVAPFLTNDTKTVSVPKFNSSLGTLTEVDLSFSISGSSDGTITNDAPTPETFTFFIQGPIDLDNGATTLLSPAVTTSQSYTNVPSQATVNYGPFTPSDSSSGTYTSGPNFVLFGTGTGNVTLTVTSALNEGFTGGGGNESTAINTFVGGTVSVTYQYTPLPVSIAGNVYQDKDGTGALAAGDPPIPGTILTLTDSSGATVATTTTAANGTYSFTTTTAGSPLQPGTYEVTETQPAGYLQGSNTVGTVNGTTDGTLIPVDMIGSIVLESGQASINNNFGEVLPVTIAGNVYQDKNGTGVLSTGDLPIPGTTLTLTNASGATVATTTTAADGTYSFTTNANGSPLTPGTYEVSETQPTGYLQGSNTVGMVNGTTDGVLIPVDKIGSIALESGQASVNNNFGEVLPVTIAGNVYEDKNGTGVLSTGDSPIPGTTLTLINASGTTVATTTTAADGTYSFTTNANGSPLTPGTYEVTETQPTGYLQGSNTVGSVNGTTDGVLIPVDMIGSIALSSGQNSVSNNFGEVLPVTIAGNVYEDKNGTGVLSTGDSPIPGTTLTLINASGTTVATTTTAADGTYSFTTNANGSPLTPGTYEVTETQPTGYLQGSNTVGTVNGTTDGVLIPVDMIGSIALSSGQNSVSNNFGEILPVTIAGNVYYDKNGTGVLSPGDSPIPGTSLTLTDASGATVATTTTAADGTYRFTTTSAGSPLPPGTYKVSETQPTGYLQGSNTVGTVNGRADGVLIPVDMIASIALESGQVSVGNNFGELVQSVTPPPPPPPVMPPPLFITTVQRFGVHHQDTLLVLTFNTPLNPSSAADVANYQIYGPLDSAHPMLIPVTSAIYDPTTQTVTLHLSQNLNVHHPYRLTVNGLVNTSGSLLEGNNGVAGSGFVTVINRSTLSGFTDHYGNFVPINHGKFYPAALSAGYHYKPFVLPKNLGSFAIADEVAYNAATHDLIEGSKTLVKRPAQVHKTSVQIAKPHVKVTPHTLTRSKK